MAERIIHSKSVFKVDEWERQFKKSRKIQKLMSRPFDTSKIRQVIEKGIARRSSYNGLPQATTETLQTLQQQHLPREAPDT
jgi:hypothetical protein